MNVIEELTLGSATSSALIASMLAVQAGSSTFLRQYCTCGFRRHGGKRSMTSRVDKRTLAIVATAAFASHPGTACADGVAAEIRRLKEAVKQLEPLKARIKLLETEVAKEKHDATNTRSHIHNAIARPAPAPRSAPGARAKSRAKSSHGVQGCHLPAIATAAASFHELAEWPHCRISGS